MRRYPCVSLSRGEVLPIDGCLDLNASIFDL
jgi:hypothetical protein